MNHDKFLKYLQPDKLNELGITERFLEVNHTAISILYIQQLTDRDKLTSTIIKPLLQQKTMKSIHVETIVKSIIYIDDVTIEDDPEKIIHYLLDGFSVIIGQHDNKYIVANTLKIQKRQVESPDVESTIIGSKDSFTENYDDNLSLIRYRIKDPNLRIKELSIGERSHTKVAVIYMQDITNKQLVSNIVAKLQQIQVDGVFESGYIQKFLMSNSYNFYPHTGIIERSETACSNLLDGKLIVLVEGGNLALVLPKTFIDFIDASDDHYSTIYISLFSKYIRILCFIISVFLTSLYIAVVSFHSDILPPQYIIDLAITRASVPFNAFLEAFLMEMVVEILREASIRLPKQIGPAIGIVGTIVIGQASVTAGLVSPLLIIIVSLSLMSSFAAGDYSISNALRLLKFMMMIITGIFGLFGFTMGIIIIIISLCAKDSFGTSYTAPISPFSGRDLKNLLLSDAHLSKHRPSYLKTKDDTRQ